MTANRTRRARAAKRRQRRMERVENDLSAGWLRRKRLDERSFLLRHHEISGVLSERFRNGTVDEIESATDTATP